MQSKRLLAENQAIASMALSTKVDPQELFILQAKRAQAAMEEAQSYWRHGCSTRTTTSTRSKLRADRDRCEIKRPLPKPNHAVQYKSYSLKMSLTSSSFEDFVEPSKPSNWMGVFLWLEALRSSWSARKEFPASTGQNATLPEKVPLCLSHSLGNIM